MAGWSTRLGGDKPDGKGAQGMRCVDQNLTE